MKKSKGQKMESDRNTAYSCVGGIITADVPPPSGMLDLSEDDVIFANTAAAIWREVCRKLTNINVRLAATKVIAVYDELRLASEHLQRTIIDEMDKGEI